jgi:hypothetical protein
MRRAMTRPTRSPRTLIRLPAGRRTGTFGAVGASSRSTSSSQLSGTGVSLRLGGTLPAGEGFEGEGEGVA